MFLHPEGYVTVFNICSHFYDYPALGHICDTNQSFYGLLKQGFYRYSWFLSTSQIHSIKMLKAGYI